MYTPRYRSTSFNYNCLYVSYSSTIQFTRTLSIDHLSIVVQIKSTPNLGLPTIDQMMSFINDPLQVMNIKLGTFILCPDLNISQIANLEETEERYLGLNGITVKELNHV